MSAKGIREATGKDLLNRHLVGTVAAKAQFVSVDDSTDLDLLPTQHPWLTSEVF